jgi:ABC-type uncharacterized transport system permease subunit
VIEMLIAGLAGGAVGLLINLATGRTWLGVVVGAVAGGIFAVVL